MDTMGPMIDAAPRLSEEAFAATISDWDRRQFLKVISASAAGCIVAGCIQLLNATTSSDTLQASDESSEAIEARFYTKLAANQVQCGLCPRQCMVSDGSRGHCQVRENRKGKYYSLVHSRLCTAHVDPIEKKPFFHFRPGTMAFSVATGGCNVNCKFCQNWEISQVRPEELRRQYVSPSRLANAARLSGCPTLAYTYSEPIIAAEYYVQAADAGHIIGIKSVFVSNGYINREPLNRLCETTDAIKIDLKAFSEKYYEDIVNAQLRPVLDAMVCIRKRGVWLEVVYLVVPTLNDSDAEFKSMAKWVKTELGSDVPVHFSRFYPLYRLKNLPPTPLATLERAKGIADAEGLSYVYLGNIPGHPSENTYCPKCKHAVVVRTGFIVQKMQLKKGKCAACGQPIPGVWS